MMVVFLSLLRASCGEIHLNNEVLKCCCNGNYGSTIDREVGPCTHPFPAAFFKRAIFALKKSCLGRSVSLCFQQSQLLPYLEEFT